MGISSLKRQYVASVSAAVLLLAILAAPASAAIPIIPHGFYGAVTINGQPAPAGTTLEARGTNVKTGLQGNPLTTTQAGFYGGPMDLKLAVQGDITNGTPIEFYINGVRAECSAYGGPWQTTYPFETQALTRLDLRIGQGPTANTSNPTATPTVTATATATGSSTGSSAQYDVPAPTATRQTPQATQSTAAAQPEAGAAATSQPASAQVSGAGTAVVTQPTQVAGQSAEAAPPSATPAVAVEPAQAAIAEPTATVETQPTAPPASPTPATVARVAASTPRATSKPILSGEDEVVAQSTPAPAVPGPDSASPGGLLARLLGGVALITVVLAGAVVVRRRWPG